MNRAEMGATGADFDFFDDAAVLFSAFCPCHLIGVMHFLVTPHRAEGVAVVNIRTASRINGPLKNRPY